MDQNEQPGSTNSATNKNFCRRDILASTAVLSGIGIAGCVGGGGSGGASNSSGSDSNATSVELASGTQGTNAYDSGLGILRAVEEHSNSLDLTITEGGGYVNQAFLFDGGEVNAVALNNSVVV